MRDEFSLTEPLNKLKGRYRPAERMPANYVNDIAWKVSSTECTVGFCGRIVDIEPEI